MKSKKAKLKEPDLPLKSQAHQLFPKALLQWNSTENNRQMPWKGEKDPYRIWLSEIILQQTRVEQGLKYYENFIRAFPDVHTLANAPEEQVFKLWEGLGYYSRCRNLLATARHISKELGGRFPETYNEILSLKGIGPYTAAAIASFAYNLPYAVLDGNVFRVVSRICDQETPIDSTEGKNLFSKLSQSLLPEAKAGAYNQAIMDFGATICKPYPECGHCFFNPHCLAFLRGKQDLLPVKSKKTKTRERWLNYFVLRYKDEVALHQRRDKDIWQELFEFPVVETGEPAENELLIKLVQQQYKVSEFELVYTLRKKQRLTHQLIQFNFLEIRLSKKIKLVSFNWIPLSSLPQFALPKTLQEYARDRLIDAAQLTGK
jgi:A/G-specific adenine glycosylase